MTAVGIAKWCDGKERVKLARMVRQLAAILVVLGLGGMASAEVVSVEESVGSLVARSDGVVRGKAIRSERVASPDPRVHSAYPWWKVTLEVHESIRGPAGKELVVFDDSGRELEYTQRQSEQLFFLQSGKSAGAMHPGLAGVYLFVDWAILGTEPIDLDGWAGEYRPMRTDDLRTVRLKEDLLEEVRRAAKQLHGSRAHVMVLFGDADRRGLGLGHSWLDLAVTDDSCAAAREWILSADGFTQWAGAELLARRRSPENEEALRRFAWAMPAAAHPYGLHAQARLLALLHSWGVTDLPPLVRTSAPAFGLVDGMSFVGALLMPVVYVCWRRMRTRVVVVVWWLMIGVIGVLLVRSYGPRDALTWGNYDMAAERGWLYLVNHKRAELGLRSPLLYCRPKDLLEWQGVEYAVPGTFGEFNELGEWGPLWRGDSFAKLTWPFGMSRPWMARLNGPDWAVHGGAILGLLLVPGVWSVGRAWWGRRRARRAARFPVMVGERSTWR